MVADAWPCRYRQWRYQNILTLAFPGYKCPRLALQMLPRKCSVTWRSPFLRTQQLLLKKDALSMGWHVTFLLHLACKTFEVQSEWDMANQDWLQKVPQLIWFRAFYCLKALHWQFLYSFSAPSCLLACKLGQSHDMSDQCKVFLCGRERLICRRSCKGQLLSNLVSSASRTLPPSAIFTYPSSFYCYSMLIKYFQRPGVHWHRLWSTPVSLLWHGSCVIFQRCHFSDPTTSSTTSQQLIRLFVHVVLAWLVSQWWNFQVPLVTSLVPISCLLKRPALCEIVY